MQPYDWSETWHESKSANRQVLFMLRFRMPCNTVGGLSFQCRHKWLWPEHLWTLHKSKEPGEDLNENERRRGPQREREDRERERTESARDRERKGCCQPR